MDARWAPALIACLLLGQWAPTASASAGALASDGCALVALIAALALLALHYRTRRREGPFRHSSSLRRSTGSRQGNGLRRSTTAGLLTALALAGTCAALLLQQVALTRSAAEAAGWDHTVRAEHPVRLQLTPGTAPVGTETRFGPRWHTEAEVIGFGHPLAALTPPARAVLTGDGPPPALTPGRPVCLIAVPRQEGATLFLTARITPEAGPCPRPQAGAHGRAAAVVPHLPGTPHTPGSPDPPQHQSHDDAAAPTGRDLLRDRFRELSATGVGPADQLLPGLVLGDRSAQTPELDLAMKHSGLSHLSAVSGSNVALLLGAVTLTLRTARVHRTTVLLGGLGTLLAFVLVVGPEPSVLRASVMGGLGALALFLGRSREAFSILTAGATALLVAAPGLATQVAFHLSLAATAGIVLVSAPLDARLHTLFNRLLPDAAARLLSSALAVTLAAHLACQPILLAMTGTVSTWSIPANLLAAPAVPAVTVLGTLAAALTVPAPPVAASLLWLVQWPAAWIGHVAVIAAQAPLAVRPWPQGPLGVALGALLTAAILAGFRALLLLERTPQAPVRRVGAGAHGRGRGRPAAGLILAGVLAAAALGASGAVVVPRPVSGAPPGWALAFCDVGQGDMTVVRTSERSALVLDTGPEPEPAARCLADLGVERVDALLLTHLHADHAGGIAAFTGALTPGQVHYATRDGATTAGLGPTRGEAAGVAPPPGASRLTTGEQGRAGAATWQVLLADARAAEENDASAQVLVTVDTGAGPLTVLVTGDLEEQAAAAWVRGLRSDAAPPPRVDVLKVSHHGARNGGLDLPRAVGARMHVISVGAENSYGHPHPVTVRGLEQLGPVARTDRHGTLALVPGPAGELVAHTVRAPAAPAP